MSNIAILSTGDPEKDRERLGQAQTFDDRIRQGICPNGCAELVWATAHLADCPDCGFKYSTNLPYGKQEDEYESLPN